MNSYEDDTVFVSPPPSKFDSDKKEAEAALEELNHFMRRQDVPPDISTLDPNLRRAKDHLEHIIDGCNSEP